MRGRPSPEAIQLFRETLLDEALRERRDAFCRAVSVSLDSIASWLGVDSWLGGGDVAHDIGADRRDQDGEERFVAFRASAGVIEMASELAAVSISALDGGHRYAGAAVIRQLIEAEYLLAAFHMDFSTAHTWATSSPDQIRRSFTPKAMRQLGGFSNEEYWRHCDMGGHPSPSGGTLLQFSLTVPFDEDDFLTASMWGDLAQHLRRLWHRADELLLSQHARYEKVRSDDRAHVLAVEAEWVDEDPLAAPTDFSPVEQIAGSADARRGDGDAALPEST